MGPKLRHNGRDCKDMQFYGFHKIIFDKLTGEGHKIG